ncbi:putative nuclease HARBI1 [Aricia agestis]|uniref:putative nuclease HARBI1 n=1 Tax=Aricia agestis TaxID=91739 RepID=UPI001C207988|nr:putative nuclease HARBI1 [Aricia agestis]
MRNTIHYHISRIVNKVTNAIIQLRNRHIKMPTTARGIQEKQSAFYTIANFPSVIGTIDCTHVKIQSPGGDDAELFRNRKSYFSINCQTISGPNLKVQNVVARWPGSTHDSAIFTNSRVCQEFESGIYGQALLLGDNGYPLKNYLITSYLNPGTPAQERFNKSQIKTRNTVERQYGVIKRRFPALAMGLRIKLERACNVIIACCILHNICVDFGEDVPPTPDELDEDTLNRRIQDGQIENQTLDFGSVAIDRRSLITQNYF